MHKFSEATGVLRVVIADDVIAHSALFSKNPKYPSRGYSPKPPYEFLLQKPFFVRCGELGSFCCVPHVWRMLVG